MVDMLDRRKFLEFLALAGLAVAAPRIAMSQQFVSGATATLSPEAKYKKINPNVMGVGLWRPPFTDTLDIFKEWFSGQSCRLWTSPDTRAWEQQIPVLQKLQPSMILMFLALATKPVVRYSSQKDNNLSSVQVVNSITNRITEICEVLAKNKISPPDGLFWEAWNEPAYEIGGKWNPEDLARYVNELGGAVKKLGLPVKVLAPLNQEFDERAIRWNETYCSMLDASVVGGLVTHYYSHHWSSLSIPADEFLRRAGYGSIMEARVRQDRSYVSRYGHGNWGLHCSEWNIHPPGVTSQNFSASRDMAAALFAFDTVKIFMEQELTSAQFFHLLNDWITSHFAVLTHTHAGENIIHPTGALFELFHKYLDGNLFKVEIESPSYTRASDYPMLPEYQVPYVGAIGCISGDRRISLFLSNKHSENINVKLRAGDIPARANGVLLQGSGDARDSAVLSEISVDLAAKSIVLQGRSIMVFSWLPG